MKKLLITFLITIFLTFSIGIGISVAKEAFAKIDNFEGSVTVLRGEESLAAANGMELEENDVIKTSESASITVKFNKELTGILSESKEMKLSDLFFKSKLDTIRLNIKKPSEGAAPGKIETVTIGGTRGTEEGEKKAKQLKNKHYWDEKVE